MAPLRMFTICFGSPAKPRATKPHPSCTARRAEVHRRQFVEHAGLQLRAFVRGRGELAFGQAVHAVVLDDVDDRYVAPDHVHELPEADRGLVVAGQPVSLSLLALNRGATDVSVSDVAIAGLTLDGSRRRRPAPRRRIKKDAVYTCSVDAQVPKNAKLTTPYFTDDYWKNPAKPRDQQLRSQRAVRRAVRADAVPRHVSRAWRAAPTSRRICRSSSAT